MHRSYIIFIFIFDVDSSSKATQCVFGSLDEYVSLPDLSKFQLKYKLPATPVTVHSGDHGLSMDSCFGTNPKPKCDEANLDTQYITAMAPYVNTTYWYIDSYSNFQPYCQFLLELLELDEPPMVNSISYGITEQVSKLISNTTKFSYNLLL